MGHQFNPWVLGIAVVVFGARKLYRQRPRRPDGRRSSFQSDPSDNDTTTWASDSAAGGESGRHSDNVGSDNNDISCVADSSVDSLSSDFSSDSGGSSD